MDDRPTPPRVKGVLETCLYAPNLDAAANFYEHVLRLPVLARSGNRHVFFHCGHAVLLLFDPAETERPDSGAAPHGTTGPGHVAFAIDEDKLDEWRAQLAREGVEIEHERNWPAGGTSIYVRDPVGNSVELATPSIWSIPEIAFATTWPHDRRRES